MHACISTTGMAGYFYGHTRLGTFWLGLWTGHDMGSSALSTAPLLARLLAWQTCREASSSVPLRFPTIGILQDRDFCLLHHLVSPTFAVKPSSLPNILLPLPVVLCGVASLPTSPSHFPLPSYPSLSCYFVTCVNQADKMRHCILYVRQDREREKRENFVGLVWDMTLCTPLGFALVCEIKQGRHSLYSMATVCALYLSS